MTTQQKQNNQLAFSPCERSKAKEYANKRRFAQVKTALIYYLRNAEFFHNDIARLIPCYKRIKAAVANERGGKA